MLYDLKGLRFSRNTYPSAAVRVLRDRDALHDTPAGGREQRVPTEYLAHARRIDATLEERGLTVRPNGVETILRTYLDRGGVKGLCFGTFSEGGRNMHALLKTVAREQAAARWRQSGARSYNEFYAYLKPALYRDWGAAFDRANTMIRIGRMERVGQRGRHANAVAQGEQYGGMEDVGGAALFADGNVPLTGRGDGGVW